MLPRDEITYKSGKITRRSFLSFQKKKKHHTNGGCGRNPVDRGRKVEEKMMGDEAD